MMYAFDIDLGDKPIYSEAVELAAISRRGERWVAIADKHGKIKNPAAFSWSQSQRIWRAVVLFAADITSESFSFDPLKDVARAWDSFSAGEQAHLFAVGSELAGAGVESKVIEKVGTAFIASYLMGNVERDLNARLAQARAAA